MWEDMLVTLAVPTLSNYGLLPYSVQPGRSGYRCREKQNKRNMTTQNVSLNVKQMLRRQLKRQVDAVVGITNIQSTSFWSQEDGSQEAGTGSGVIYKKDGGKAYIVTNNHVIEGPISLKLHWQMARNYRRR